MIKLIANNFFSLLSVQLISAFFGIITIPLLINKIGIGDFGTFSVFISIATMINICVDFGISIVGVKSVIGLKRSGIKSYVVTVFSLRLFIFIVLSSIFTFYIFFSKNDIEFFWFLLFSAGAIFQVNYYFKAIQKMWIITITTFFYRFITFILIAFSGELNLYSAAVYFCLPYFLVTLVSFLCLLLFVNGGVVQLRLELVKRVFTDSYNMFIGVFGSTLYRNLTIPLLALFMSPEVVGTYSAVEKILKGIQGIINSGAESVFPIVCKTDILKSNYKGILIFTFVASITLMTVVSCLLYFNSDYFGIVSSKYFEVILFSLTLAFSIGSICFFIGVMYYFSQGLHSHFSKITIVCGVVSISLVLVFGLLNLKTLMLFTPLITELSILILLLIRLKV